jgi:hypothetical protein
MYGREVQLRPEMGHKKSWRGGAETKEYQAGLNRKAEKIGE